MPRGLWRISVLLKKFLMLLFPLYKFSGTLHLAIYLWFCFVFPQTYFIYHGCYLISFFNFPCWSLSFKSRLSFKLLLRHGTEESGYTWKWHSWLSTLWAVEVRSWICLLTHGGASRPAHRPRMADALLFMGINVKLRKVKTRWFCAFTLKGLLCSLLFLARDCWRARSPHEQGVCGIGLRLEPRAQWSHTSRELRGEFLYPERTLHVTRH